MRRLAVLAAAVLSLGLLSGCSDDGGGGADDGAASSASASPSDASSTAPDDPTSAPASTPSVDEFCDRVRRVSTSDGQARVLAGLELIQGGLPGELDGRARDGVQVLVDLLPRLTSVREGVAAYRDLSGAERGDLTRLVGFLTVECGKEAVAELLPSIPSLPELPSLPSLSR